MRTAFQSGPGFYAADTSPHDASLPPDTMRIYCARLEAYDLPLKKEGDEGLDTTFALLVAKPEDDPRMAKALLKLARAVECNRAGLEKIAATAKG